MDMDYGKIIKKRKAMKSMGKEKFMQKEKNHEDMDDMDDKRMIELDGEEMMKTEFKEGKPVKFSGIGRMMMKDGKPCMMVDNIDMGKMMGGMDGEKEKGIRISPSA